MPDKRLRPLMEAGAELGWNRPKMLRLANAGRIPAVKVSGLWYFVGSVDEWIDSMQQEHAEERQSRAALRDSARAGRRKQVLPALPERGRDALADLLPKQRRF